MLRELPGALTVRVASRTEPVFIVPVAVALLAILGFGPSAILALLSCSVLILGVFLLWRPGEAPILLYLFVYQWLQASFYIFYANGLGLDLAQVTENLSDLQKAVPLALVGLAALSIGMRLGTGRRRTRSTDAVQQMVLDQPQSKWFRIHLVVWVSAAVARLLAVWIPGLSQPLLALADFQWGTYVIFSIVTFARRDTSRALWFAVFAVELAFSLGGYFSSFKFVFLYTLIALAAAGVKLTWKQVVTVAVFAAITLVLGLYWTAIKTKYRDFVSGGQQSQVVAVGKVEAIAETFTLIWQVNPYDLGAAADQLAERFAEIDVFGAVVDYVPAIVPHQSGKIWLDAIERPFMPRILFPGKAVIDETQITNEYTGLNFAGTAEGTQVSMGYIADAYIDFGEVGMMGALATFGVGLGLIYRWFIKQKAANGLLGSGLATVTLMQASDLGFSSAKLVGGIVVCILVAAVLFKFVVPHYLRRLSAHRVTLHARPGSAADRTIAPSARTQPIDARKSPFT